MGRNKLEIYKRKCENNKGPCGYLSRPFKYVFWDYNYNWFPGWCQLVTDKSIIGDANPGF